MVEAVVVEAEVIFLVKNKSNKRFVSLYFYEKAAVVLVKKLLSNHIVIPVCSSLVRKMTICF